MKGDLLSRQALPPGRDQGKTREAIKAYTLFLEREPGTPRSREVSGKILELRNRLACTRRPWCSTTSPGNSTKAPRPAPVGPSRRTPTCRSPRRFTPARAVARKTGKKDDAEIARKALAENYPDGGEEAGCRIEPRQGVSNENAAPGPPGPVRDHPSGRYVAAKGIDADGGSELELDPGLGFGLGFGYNFTNKLALHLDGSWTRADYRAKITTTDGSGISSVPTTVGGTLDTTTVALNLSYYFLDGPLTPSSWAGSDGRS